MKLFQKANVLDLERHLDQRLKDYVRDLEFNPDSAEDIIPGLIERNRVVAPELELGEELQPSKQLERTVEDDGRYSRIPFPQRYKVLDVTYEIGVRGDSNLLDFAPQSYSFTYSSSQPERRGNHVVLTYTLPLGGDPSQVAAQVSADVTRLKQNVAGLQQWASNWNASLDNRVRSALAKRSTELRQRDAAAQGLKIRI